jgi:uncharacterized membrane-anchored protein
MKPKTMLLLFLLVVILQLSVPLYMMWHWENVLNTGRPFYWVTAPVDPYDLLKGRYVDLGFKEQKGIVLDDEKFQSGQKAYALLTERDGKAVISSISASQPDNDVFVRVTIQYVENNVAHVSLPFKRYYLPENVAPAADIAYRKSAGKDGVALIRIKDGYGVVEQLYIGNKTIYEYLQSQ